MSDVVRRRLSALAQHRVSDEGGDLASAGSPQPRSESADHPTQEPAPRHVRAATEVVPEGRQWPQLGKFGRAHAAAVALLALLGMGWAGWSVFATRVTPVVAATPVPIATAESSTPTPTPEPSPQVRVHVVGAVEAPGVVGIVSGSRVEDALAAAGGLKSNARPGQLNLAAPVPDGAQILVGDTDDPGGELRLPLGGQAPGGALRVNLNSASPGELETLPGIGPVTAAAIVAWRAENGDFTSVDQLEEVPGIGAATRARIAPVIDL
ncbi:MAG: helix-hairpin-helix domain-containing protein [Propioniciclava sp.]